jgi:hypothetical protein
VTEAAAHENRAASLSLNAETPSAAECVHRGTVVVLAIRLDDHALDGRDGQLARPIAVAFMPPTPLQAARQAQGGEIIRSAS